MFKRIKILSTIFDDKNNDMNGQEVDALITFDENNSNACFFNGNLYGANLLNTRLTDNQFEVIGELHCEKERYSDIERNENAKGYAIVPLKFLDKEFSDEFDEESTITAKELISMNCSAMMAVNNGDTGKNSLNKKLYVCTRDFVEYELDKVIVSNE